MENNPFRIKTTADKSWSAITPVGWSAAGKKKFVFKLFGYALLLALVAAITVQYLNAAKYEALVQVIPEDKIGINPTSQKLDFGDLPRDRSTVRTVTLKSDGDTPAYVMVWKFGDISDLMKVNKNYFTLDPHSSQKLDFSVYVPNSAEYRYYNGQVMIFQIPKIW